MVADCDGGDALAHALHHARRLVAEHAGEEAFRVLMSENPRESKKAEKYRTAEERTRPSSVYASVWQSAVCVIRMRTSLACGGATVTVVSRRSCAAKATAALHVIDLPAVSDMAGQARGQARRG